MASPPEPAHRVDLRAPPSPAADELRLLATLARRDGKLAPAESELLLTYALGGLSLARDEAEEILRSTRTAPADGPAPRLPEPRRTLHAMLEVALADGQLTVNERAFVERVGCELGVPLEEVRAALQSGLAEDRRLRDEADLGPPPAPPPRSGPPSPPVATGPELGALGAWLLLAAVGWVAAGALGAAVLGALGAVLVALSIGRILGRLGAGGQDRALLRAGEPARGRVRVVEAVRRGERGRDDGGPRREVLVGWDVHYSYRHGDHRGTGRVRVPAHKPLERGRAVWVLVDPQAPGRSTLDARYL